MTNDEERRQLELELLAVKLSLKRKQEFWETPRNIAILVGVTAAIAAAIGFWLGRGSTPAPPVPTPAFGVIDPVSVGQFMDAVQTAGIIVIAAMLVYVVVRLDRTLTAAAEKIQKAMGDQSQVLLGMRRLWERIDLIESQQKDAGQQNDRAVLGEWVGRAWQHIEKIEARLEAVEKGEPRPEGTRPTDPPLGSGG